MSRPERRKKWSGFSIVEILVVCASLAVLAAILFPMFTEAKKSSRRVLCASNLRQFASAFSIYSHDWNDYWPCPGGKPDYKSRHSYWAQSGSGGLQSYLNGRGVESVWCCPTVNSWAGQYAPRSYSMNSYLRTPADYEYPSCCDIFCGVNVSQLSRPGKTVLLYEGINLADDSDDELDYIYRCANWAYVSGYGEHTKHPAPTDKPVHGRLNNYLYCDGHIVARRPGLSIDRLTNGRMIAGLSTYSEMYEWYVDKAKFEKTPQTKLLPRD